MTENNNLTDDLTPVSIVTKHIKIYSDNPIHDAIDRIIDAVAAIDDGQYYMNPASSDLLDAARDLLHLAQVDLLARKIKEQRDKDEQKSN